MGFLVLLLYDYGAPLGDPSGRRTSARKGYMPVISKPRTYWGKTKMYYKAITDWTSMPTELKKLVFEDRSVVISLRKLTALLYVCLGCSLLFRLGHEGVRFLGDTGQYYKLYKY